MKTEQGDKFRDWYDQVKLARLYRKRARQAMWRGEFEEGARYFRMARRTQREAEELEKRK